MFVQAPTYLIIVGVKSEGISKMLKCFLVFPKLMKNEYRKLYSISDAYIWYVTYSVVFIACVHTISLKIYKKHQTSKKKKKSHLPVKTASRELSGVQCSLGNI